MTRVGIYSTRFVITSKSKPVIGPKWLRCRTPEDIQQQSHHTLIAEPLYYLLVILTYAPPPSYPDQCRIDLKSPKYRETNCNIYPGPVFNKKHTLYTVIYDRIIRARFRTKIWPFKVIKYLESDKDIFYLQHRKNLAGKPSSFPMTYRPTWREF